ncbi:bifunctional hydroxymethylpyrimidine kinase/phosphomethylpyrimidine kinase [Beijerinckia indica]|uniref:hydroxymethylpyrimidine kinase n=1 Tax=Beijerinckia indica subsp. indica (strain ATCC 9039 / DSM 1715 / NCIMB 8712) TaxID=395963 RepID=B2IBR1_BEII9|nr:bifunctional hydroxymethylpyrimidine kinase/phosphomethylpyrimidine kinase [Beijerinckia indica]ACB93783.1 phosphomethylpyrimidine kinase [Beijerinckia indica subsp. indica ATCC 9039]
MNDSLRGGAERAALIPNVLSIAGSDPSGGAGIQADLKTFAALECHGMAAITALTVQNTQGVRAIHVPPADFVGAEIDALFADSTIAAVKIGMLAEASIAKAVAASLARHAPPHIILDPVLAATSGDSLSGPALAEALVTHLFPLATLVTPNLSEAAHLTGLPFSAAKDSMGVTAEALMACGARAVLLKGGHLEGDLAEDLLYTASYQERFSARRVETRNTHGTGCTLASAIAAFLAHGHDLRSAVAAAKAYLTRALESADRLDVGQGHGPVHHFHALWPSRSGGV